MSQDLTSKEMNLLSKGDYQEIDKKFPKEKINSFHQKKKTTPIFQVLMNNRSFEIIKLVISKGADLNLCNGQNYTPLHYACQENFPRKVIELFLENGSQVNRQIESLKWTALHFACSVRCDHSVIDLLLLKGASPLLLDCNNKTPIHLHCSDYPKINSLKRLFSVLSEEQISDVINLKDLHGFSMLHLVCRSCPQNELLSYLIGLGADCSLKNDKGYTPLHYLAMNKDGYVGGSLKLFSISLDYLKNNFQPILEIAKENSNDTFLIDYQEIVSQN
ncbi:ankyrin repeat-containing protein [Anaeramoeba flamelloides]|uniref:Ankyrin repeat-containing protein n=1 Tax=Anaeramoeba flamelloides TaxID=1746091 RepID=A0ABQ8XBG3_9EUKA|nr:ankyrin repeat-containing protein [Anaeramoeba flamelloides]